MGTTPKVSIIIPVFNGSNYLSEAIDSALAQTYQNIEIIVVNDGSDDGGKTETTARSYGNEIRYFSKENGGVASALNFGIGQMTGEWFVWLSHDDFFSKNRIEEDINIIKNNSDARIIFCKLDIINENGKLIEEIIYPINKITNAREVLELGGVDVDMCSMTIHKSCFNEVGLFDEKNRTTQDTQMLLLLSSHFPFYLNSKSIMYRRDHKERGTYTLSEQHKKDLLYLCDFIHDKLSVDNFFPEVKNNPNSTSDALVWMGFFYYLRGASNHADECFHKSVYHEKNILKKIIITFKITSRIIIIQYKEKRKKLLMAIIPSPIYLFLRNIKRTLIKIVQNE